MNYQKHDFTPGAVLFASQLNDMDNQIEALSNQESTLSENFKVALLNCFENVAWVNQNGQSYYDELYNALYPDIFWTVTNVLSGCTNSNNITNVLKNSSYVGTITADRGYTLDSATVSILMGGNDVTNLYYSSGSINIPNVTGDLVITVNAVTNVDFITAVFTQGSAVIYDVDTLDTLRQYLVVTATYADSTTEVIDDYTLSGTLDAGVDTITVSYINKTTTFDVNVTAFIINWDYTMGLPENNGMTKVVAAAGSTTITMTENGLNIRPSGEGAGVIYKIPFSDNCFIEATFVVKEKNNNIRMLLQTDIKNVLYTRTQYSDNYKGVYLANGNGGTLADMTLLQSVTTGSTYKIKMVRNGNTGSVYINDVLKTNSAPTQQNISTGWASGIWFAIAGAQAATTTFISLRAGKGSGD